MKKAIAIYGGPRRYSNTELLLDKFLESVDKNEVIIEKIILKDLNMSPCTSCYGCSSTGECVLKDDMDDLYHKLKNADVIVLASPIYFAGVSAMTKSMIDRCQAFWSAKYLANKREHGRKKKGIFIATAGSDDSNSFKWSEYTVKLFFASCDAEFSSTLFAGGTDGLPVDKNQEILEKASILGRSIATNS